MLGFAAGRLQRISLTGGLDVLAQPDADAARVGRLFAPTADMAAFFAERAGAPMPGGRYTQVLTSGDEAQEAAGFSVLSERVVAAQEQEPQEDWAIAHELAHQWWGVSVTCADWSHMWLNEGVVTFMVAAWKERRWGADAYRREIELNRRRWQTLVARDRDYPLAYAGVYPSLGARRAIAYAKAAVFPDTLRTHMGEDAFWRGLRAYTRARMGSSVVSDDFQRAMEMAAGESLAPLFDTWVRPTAGG